MRNLVAIASAMLFLTLSPTASGIDETYRLQLERSGCTQVSELQGCDINKSREENARAGFVDEDTESGDKADDYDRLLERSGCTQVSEAQGCDIHKTREQNARAGFGSDNSANDDDVGYQDLIGKQAISAFDQMAVRGFQSVDNIESGDTYYTIYFRRSTGECIQLTSANNRVLSVDDIGTHRKCR